MESRRGQSAARSDARPSDLARHLADLQAEGFQRAADFVVEG